MKNGIKITIIVIGLLLALGISGYSVMAQEGTPTVTASPMGTLTPFPTNTTPTPGDGSGCPTTIPTLMQGAYYQKCKVCWENSENPVMTHTPTNTGQPSNTPTITKTPTITPNGGWYGFGKPINENYTSVNGADSDTGVYSSSNLCGGSNRLAGLVVNFQEHATNKYWWKEKFDGGAWSTSYNSRTITLGPKVLHGPLNLNIYNLMIADYTQWHTLQLNYNNYNSIQIRFSSDYGKTNHYTVIKPVCLNYSYQSPTVTPTATAQPTPLCIQNDHVKCISNMDTFNAGLAKVDDGKIAYYRIYPYDVGQYKSMYEKDFYNKNFYIELNVSGSTSFEFVETDPEVPIFYGPHQITGYDCANNIIFENTLGAGPSATKGWNYPKSSICKVQVQTIDDGLEKQFSSDGVIVNGCDQLNCDSDYTGYTFDPDAKFGFDPGGWNDTVCDLIFPGIDLSFMKDPLDTVFTWVTGNDFQLDMPIIPWIMICVHSWVMPQIRFMDLDIPIGNILIIAIIPLIFKAIGGKK